MKKIYINRMLALFLAVALVASVFVLTTDEMTVKAWPPATTPGVNDFGNATADLVYDESAKVTVTMNTTGMAATSYFLYKPAYNCSGTGYRYATQMEWFEQVEDADIVVCAYGITARIARFAVQMARDEGIRAGLLKLITVWPFAEERVRELSLQAKAFIVPEINYGQVVLEVERCAGGNAKTMLIPHMGGDVHLPVTILDAIREVAK